MGINLTYSYPEIVAMILFGIGFTMLFFDRNLIKKIIGFNFMDSGIFLFLASGGYIEGRISPIIQNGETEAAKYINPAPAGLVLTGIVVSVSSTALMLALTIRLYVRYRTLDIDKIVMEWRKEEELP